VKLFRTRHDLLFDCIQELFIYIWEKRNGLGNTNNIRYYLFNALRRRMIVSVSGKSWSAKVYEIVQVAYPIKDPIEQILIKDQADAELKILLWQALRQLTSGNARRFPAFFWQDDLSGSSG